MNTESVHSTAVANALEALRREVAQLGERVAALEKGTVPQPLTATRTAPPASAAAAEDLSEELVLVISAAVAAFLGKKPHIRQIRLVGAAAWAQEGRVMIQASHALSPRHARS